ncbi:MAG: hypothetical protein E7378_02790 [Clostridiales bacterium]|nr:hypothetical protein [Clostridiales bacterium]
MKDFQTSRNGYKKEEVREYIDELESECEDLKVQNLNLAKQLDLLKERQAEVLEKEHSISLALTAAVEKAKQIEKSSYNVYRLKIEELEILYARWEHVLNELIANYPNLDEIDNVKKLMTDFKATIKANIKEDFKFTAVPNNSQKDQDPMRVLLSRMNGAVDRQIEERKTPQRRKTTRRQLSKDVLTKQTELCRLEEKAVMIKPIYEAKMSEGETGATLLDRFLSDDASLDSAYATNITAKCRVTPKANETGFDLKEAVNPKDSLEQIMKSFDFFAN